MTGISQITKIENLGIFGNYTWPSEPENLAFKRINFLYGYNGSGKTTLSNIIDLFSSDLEAPDQKRIAQNMANDTDKNVAVEMLCDDKTAKYPQDRLKTFVFNSAFVADHVYDGRQEKVTPFKNTVVTKEHLSSPAVQKMEDEIKNQNKRKNTVEGYQTELSTLAREIKDALSKRWNDNIEGRRLPQGLNLDNCPQKIPQESEKELEKALEDQFSRFKISKDQEQLEKDIAFLRQMGALYLTLPDTLKDTLRKSISETARQKVQQKIEAFKNHELKHTTPQNWFEDGSSLLKHNKDSQTCPLCDSTVKDIDEIIASYDAFFNDELEDLKREITAAIDSLNAVLTDSASRKDHISGLKTILVRYGYQKLASDNENTAFQSLTDQSIKSHLEIVKELFKKKRDSISYNPEQDDLSAVDKMLVAFQHFQKDIAVLVGFKDRILDNLQEARFNDGTAKDICKNLFWKKFDIQGKTKANNWFKEDQVREEELKISIAENTHGIALYHFLKKRLDAIAKIISKKENEKAEELSKLKKESEYVNAFLERLCVRNFTINTEDKGEITIHYKGVKPKKGIAYSLSEGEKTTLAFAYFLSKYQYEVLDNDNEKPEDYIIVIDDPVSSLDENRLFSTALVIQEFLLPKAVPEGNGENKKINWSNNKQIFIFSHNLIFLKFMGNVIDSNQNKDRADFYLDKGKLSYLPDALKNYQTSYFYKLNKIKAFVDGASSVNYEIAKDYLPNYIRTILEAFISFKFARLSGASGNRYQPAMFDYLIRHLDGHAHKFEGFIASGNISCKDTLKSTLQRIKEKVNPENHGTVQDITHIEYLPESELKETAEQALNVIQFLDQIHFEAVQSLNKVAA